MGALLHEQLGKDLTGAARDGSTDRPRAAGAAQHGYRLGGHAPDRLLQLAPITSMMRSCSGRGRPPPAVTVHRSAGQLGAAASKLAASQLAERAGAYCVGAQRQSTCFLRSTARLVNQKTGAGERSSSVFPLAKPFTRTRTGRGGPFHPFLKLQGLLCAVRGELRALEAYGGPSVEITSGARYASSDEYLLDWGRTTRQMW
ncbi:hypothetical protein T492DRAFT_1142661 [Pavlovales sp. CCMP2436]|nr:hypothetical protein T492DRAFT_1142661 [Pavlovales sp. CCMP2436]